MTGRYRPKFGKFLNSRAVPLRMSQAVLVARTKGEIEAMALQTEAARCWAAATGLPTYEWLGCLEPRLEALVTAVRAALAEGATVSRRGAWRILTATDGTRLVVAADVLADGAER